MLSLHAQLDMKPAIFPRGPKQTYEQAQRSLLQTGGQRNVPLSLQDCLAGALGLKLHTLCGELNDPVRPSRLQRRVDQDLRRNSTPEQQPRSGEKKVNELSGMGIFNLENHSKRAQIPKFSRLRRAFSAPPGPAGPSGPEPNPPTLPPPRTQVTAPKSLEPKSPTPPRGCRK